jgi:hypothetical protein
MKKKLKKNPTLTASQPDEDEDEDRGAHYWSLHRYDE